MTIHRCPNPECGGEWHPAPNNEIVYYEMPDAWHIKCNLCGYMSPGGDNHEEAARLHNAMCLPAAPDDAKQGTSQCPVCGVDKPHSHSKNDITKWLQAQASRFGYQLDSARMEPEVVGLKELALGWRASCNSPYYSKSDMALERCANELDALIARSVPPDDWKGQPVAWRYQDVTGKWCYRESTPQTEKERSEAQPLYAHPAPQGWQQGAAREEIEGVLKQICKLRQDLPMSALKGGYIDMELNAIAYRLEVILSPHAGVK